MPQRVLDIVAEHPEEQHVAAEMEDVAMQEGVGNVGQVLGDDRQVRREVDVVEDHRRDVAQPIDCRDGKLLRAEVGEEIDDDIDRDQPEGDILQLDAFQAVGVVQRNEHLVPPLPPAITVSTVLAGNP